MSIWNKVLVGLIAVASLVFLYFAMRTLKTHQYWRELARKHEQEIKRVQDENVTLLEGSGEGDVATPGIERLKLELDKALLNRQRIWNGCVPQIGPQAGQTGQVAVTIDQPNPHGISSKSVVYVFEDVAAPAAPVAPAEATEPPSPDPNASAPVAAAPPTDPAKASQDPGRPLPAERRSYLGEFKVTAVAEKQVQLEPTAKPNPEELACIASSKGPWTLYETMPRDGHNAFAGMSEADLKRIMPPQSVMEYVKDGQIATKADLAKWGVRGTIVDPFGRELEDGKEGKYNRPLRDYLTLSRNGHANRAALVGKIETATRDRDLVLTAAEDAEKQAQFRTSEQGRLDAELKNKHLRERDAVAALRAKLQERLNTMRASTSELIASNQAVAAQIAKIQLEAARQIDSRTRGVEQTALAGAN